jgi:Tol biopolymer transport system component
MLVLLIVTSSCDKSTAPEVPLPLPLTGRIVFQSDRSDPVGDIFAITFDGSDVRRLTRSSASESCPRISPDANWIAYYSTTDDPRNSGAVYTMWLMRANGTDPAQIADVGHPSGCPLWSHSSDMIEETSSNLDGATSGDLEETRIFGVGGQEIGHFQGYQYHIEAFSNDGTEFLVSQSNCGKNGCTLPDIYVMKRDGSLERWLTGDTSHSVFIQEGAETPSLSPDGTTVTYVCSDHLQSALRGLCVVKWDGTGKTLLGSNTNALSYPTFSPDGTKIAFTCLSGNTAVLCLTDSNGGDLVTSSVANDFGTAFNWTPDGTHLIFSCGTGKDLCSIPFGGSVVTNLTQGVGTNTSPSMPTVASQ